MPKFFKRASLLHATPITDMSVVIGPKLSILGIVFPQFERRFKRVHYGHERRGTEILKLMS